MDDVLFTNLRLYPSPDDGIPGDTTSMAVSDGRITARGAEGAASRVLDLEGRLVLPGFVDCHTHAVYTGNRADEHAMRRAGATYRDIAEAGGGIIRTVRSVRQASVEDLVTASAPRLRSLLREGVTRVEIKSGYGLDLENELKMLRAIDRLRTRTPQHLTPTFLGAHAVPPGRERSGYVEELVEQMLPAVADRNLADAVDIYVESIAFDTGDLARLFEAARCLGLHLRAHVGQLSDMGGGLTAARFGALSCDHVEFIDEASVAAMAAAGTVAVLLPGAFYFLGETRKPPIDLFRAHGVRMAVATDLNPGSSPIASLQAVMHMSAVLFGLTPEEVLDAVTVNAAAALGCTDGTGTLAPGAPADFSVWSLEDARLLSYQLGGLGPDAVFIGGRQVSGTLCGTGA